MIYAVLFHHGIGFLGNTEDYIRGSQFSVVVFQDEKTAKECAQRFRWQETSPMRGDYLVFFPREIIAARVPPEYLATVESQTITSA